MEKHWGLIIVDADGKPVCGPYGHVLLFKTKEDAEPYIPMYGSVKGVVTAKIDRRKKKKPQQVEMRGSGPFGPNESEGEYGAACDPKRFGE